MYGRTGNEVYLFPVYVQVTQDAHPRRGSTLDRVTSGSKRTRIRRAITGAVIAALLFSACAADDDEAVATDDQSAEVTATGVLPTVSGSQIDVNSLEGSDTILWFWAPW